MSTLTDESAPRRTFAIISHPDARKTTLTEKLLFFGGRSSWRAPGERRRVRSDWTAVERERSISVSSPVMSLQAGLSFKGPRDPAAESVQLLPSRALIRPRKAGFAKHDENYGTKSSNPLPSSDERCRTDKLDGVIKQRS